LVFPTKNDSVKIRNCFSFHSALVEIAPWK